MTQHDLYTSTLLKPLLIFCGSVFFPWHVIYGVEENSEVSCRIRGIHAGCKEASPIVGKGRARNLGSAIIWNAWNAFIYDGQDANPAQFIFTSLSHSEILKLFRSIRNLNFELK
jgi:hypothetical protein